MIHLVGAGPGDPELLTVKAHRLLRGAGIVLHDDLVPDEILALAGPQAQIVNVGKRCGAKRTTQAEINSRMIESSRGGLDVVRLHSGDPAIFGRLGEELDALEAAGVPFEIVPGITAGVASAAALGITLTDRRKSSRVIIASGHHASKSGLHDKTDWKDLAREDATLIVYMPGSDFSALRDELLAADLDSQIPAIIVSHATTPRQQFRCATLGELHKLPRMEAPAVLLIGWPLERAYQKLSAEDLFLMLAEADLIFSAP